MIKHVVCLKFNDIEQAEIVKQKLQTLPTLIGQIKNMEVGVDVLHTERSYHLALTVVFDSLADLAVYAKHPEHMKVVEYINTVKINSITVDYEI